ncbi:hypothetical protein M090_3658 [Parabacteroides distasonis str. 3776 Po2 i]|nr:hypothetical protein M090_3658 [Parabacteroides distasonis str. 3776 Po2 i]KDS65936.1 hypothetical protein M095_2809 [Parabacteroides distasonis str. 3999B T(B) 4]KDS74778.1 hypothetical protein M096_2611 [Parabacteroides distasonis str. 3999B T(B) 6]
MLFRYLYYKQDMVSSELMYMKTANMQKGDKICMAWICNIYVI